MANTQKQNIVTRHKTTADQILSYFEIVEKHTKEHNKVNKHTTTAHQIMSNFAEGWRETAAFESTVDSEHETMREIRCCLNSEQCDLSKDRQEAVDCSQYITETSNERALLGAELFVVRAWWQRCGLFDWFFSEGNNAWQAAEP